MKNGDERTLDLAFPDPYHAAELAGKPVQFKVRLSSIKKKSLPDLTDDFAKTVDEKFETVDQLKEGVKNNILEAEERRINDDLKNRLLRKLVEANEFEVPPTMLNDQKNALVADFENRMRMQGMSEQD